MRARCWLPALVGLVASESVDFVSKFQAAVAAAQVPEPFLPPADADEWYVVTIANVSVGYMHTVVETVPETSVSTVEVMDVQVSRGTDTSRMAFETVFKEVPLLPATPAAPPADAMTTGGVMVMAYDQRFANSEVRMNASFGDSITLVSNNGEKDHTTNMPLPDDEWYGRLRARLEFARRCRQGETHITVPTMRPELGPRVVNLSATLTDVAPVWDGSAMVDSSIWTVQISDVPVNMSEAYPLAGPLVCYRMLQMGLDMPFGYLLATLTEQATALAAAESDPSRTLPELVYTMFVPLSAPIQQVYEARMVKLRVRTKGTKGRNTLALPSGGFQHVEDASADATSLLVTIDLQAPRKATAEELADKEYRLPSAMVDSSDEVIIDLAHQIDDALKANGIRPPPRLPKAPPEGYTEPPSVKIPRKTQIDMVYLLRELAHNHISSKHLSTAYASASETARTGSGDCTEHAVLLAALLKARGIPGRVCHGLVYVEQGGNAISGEAGEAGAAAAAGAAGEGAGASEADLDASLGDEKVAATVGADGTAAAAAGSGEIGQFGWHMWSQALVDGRWVDLDATLHVPFSVGHVLVGTSSMSDKEAHNNHMQMAALIGNLEIDLLDTSHDWNKAEMRP